MSPDAKKQAVTREAVLALLSDSEVAKVSREEGEPRLVEGDEYVDSGWQAERSNDTATRRIR
jgi:hypothetical protein